MGMQRITAIITARDAASTAARAGFVDATVCIDGVALGGVTLGPDGYSGKLDVWGDLGMWASDAVACWLEDMPLTSRKTAIADIVTAVRGAQ